MEPLSRLNWHSGAVSHARFCGRNSVVTSSTDGDIACWDLSESVSTNVHRDHTATSTTNSTGINSGSNSGSNSSSRSCTQDIVKPYSIHRGHVHNYNFVGLSVRPATSPASGSTRGCAPGRFLIASGSQDGRAVAYSNMQPGQLASWRLDGAPGCQSDLTAFTGGNQGGARHHAISSCPGVPSKVLQPPKSHTHCPQPFGQVSHKQAPFHSKSSCEFVSAVAWAPLTCTASEAPLLAVASSDGSATVLQLQQ